MTIQEAIKQLERSERGQMTCKLLLDFLKSPTVQGLDGRNSAAVHELVQRHMLGGGKEACEVIDGLYDVVERNQWVNCG
ncbi:MAG TPA: hypothetical protein VH595_20490 [Verrucomicrobiae bacterium]|jgi:hypothetical protein|nr:hypothetical protein [Verrucomicrobiae bacterium]